MENQKVESKVAGRVDDGGDEQGVSFAMGTMVTRLSTISMVWSVAAVLIHGHDDVDPRSRRR